MECDEPRRLPVVLGPGSRQAQHHLPHHGKSRVKEQPRKRTVTIDDADVNILPTCILP